LELFKQPKCETLRIGAGHQLGAVCQIPTQARRQHLNRRVTFDVDQWQSVARPKRFSISDSGSP
jgi:hypothetical protein